MLKFFAKCYESICSVLAFINFILLGIAFAILGYYLGDDVFYLNPVICSVIGGIVGVSIAFFSNVLVFGFIAQISDIRNSLEEIKNK